MLTTAESAAPAASRAAARRPLRVALFGGFGIGNFGNDASLEAVLAFLRAERPDVEISCICSNPREVAGTFGVETIPTVVRPKGLWRKLDTLLLRQPSAWTNWVRCLWTLRRFDVIVVPGTGVFDDFRDTPLGWPSRLLRWSIAARLHGVRMVFLSVGAGPILSPISRMLMKWAAQLATHRSYRDADSLKYMADLGVDESRSVVLPDVAFLLPPPAQTMRASSETLTVGVGIMNYSGWRKSAAVYEDYVVKHVAFIRWLEAQGHGIQILVGQDTDWITVREIETRLGRPLTILLEEEMDSFHHVIDAVAAADLVVASRYHVQIAALQQGKPVISLSYGPKNDALLANAGLKGFSQDIHRIDLDLLKRHIETIAADRPHYAAIVHERVADMQQRLRAAMKELDLLGG
jgi:polysaccharide pyruvyl transferase WcaK-like protein